VSAAFKKRDFTGPSLTYCNVQEILNSWCATGIWIDNDWSDGKTVYLRHSEQGDALVVKAEDLLEFIKATL
jgi:hypothetical protein